MCVARTEFTWGLCPSYSQVTMRVVEFRRGRWWMSLGLRGMGVLKVCDPELAQQFRLAVNNFCVRAMVRKRAMMPSFMSIQRFIAVVAHPLPTVMMMIAGAT